MVRVAALSEGRRRAALTVLLCRQVLAPRRGWRRQRLRVVVQVAGVALDGGAGRVRSPSARRIVAVAHVSAAGRRRRGEVTVAIRPVAAKHSESDTQS